MNSTKSVIVDMLSDIVTNSFKISPDVSLKYTQKYVDAGNVDVHDSLAMHGSLYPDAVNLISQYNLIPIEELKKKITL